MTATEREIVIVTGTVDSIITKGSDKWQAVVKTPDAGQYGKKIWTKDAGVFQAVTALIGQQATFECGVSHYNLPDGKPTSSLWINAVNPGAPPPQEPPGATEAVQAVAQEATGATQSASEPPPGVAAVVAVHGQRDSFGDPRQASIERQVALKCAVEIHAGTEWDLDKIIATAETFDQFLARAQPF